MVETVGYIKMETHLCFYIIAYEFIRGLWEWKNKLKTFLFYSMMKAG